MSDSSIARFTSASASVFHVSAVCQSIFAKSDTKMLCVKGADQHERCGMIASDTSVAHPLYREVMPSYGHIVGSPPIAVKYVPAIKVTGIPSSALPWALFQPSGPSRYFKVSSRLRPLSPCPAY